MNSSKCPNCSLVQWSESNCKRCGALLNGPSDAQYSQPDHYQSMPAQPYSMAMPGNQHLKSGLAVTSMILAIVALPTTFLLIGILLAPVALILGIVAIVRANKQPTIYGGKGFAIAGISVASIVLVFFVPIIAAIAIPNVLAARRAANEGSAFNTLEKIATAQQTHSSMNESGECGEMTTLAKKNLIPPELAEGKKNGYKFVAGGNVSELNGCEARATPESRSQGTRAFYFSSMDGVVRVTSTGGEAGPTDAPVNRDSRASN